jgi:hypothetical protein
MGPQAWKKGQIFCNIEASSSNYLANFFAGRCNSFAILLRFFRKPMTYRWRQLMTMPSRRNIHGSDTIADRWKESSPSYVRT